MPDHANSVPSPRTARFAYILAIGSTVLTVATLVSDQVNFFITEAHDVPCYGLDSFGSSVLDHVMRAAPFVPVLALNALSWRQASRRIFMICNAVAIVLSLLYLREVGMNWALIPGAGDCMEDEWDHYATVVGFFQFFVMWPFALICSVAFGYAWISRPRD